MTSAECLQAARALDGLWDLTTVDKLVVGMLLRCGRGFYAPVDDEWPHPCDPEPHPQRRTL